MPIAIRGLCGVRVVVGPDVPASYLFVLLVETEVDICQVRFGNMTRYIQGTGRRLSELGINYLDAAALQGAILRLPVGDRM